MGPLDNAVETLPPEALDTAIKGSRAAACWSIRPIRTWAISRR
ncbi:MAG: hypothetical protein R3C97_14825 [Geminicoccaceae bacterium]